jgi:formate-nitrite transporter family protein
MNPQSVRHLKLTEPQLKRDHIRGSADAPIKMLEYGDYECPYCGQAHPVVLAVEDELGDRLCFAFRNFPLANMHPHARQAAEAAEAAGAQGKFWEMHDMLFENQHALEAEDLAGYATALGLDARRFAGDLESRVHAQRVREDFYAGVRAGVNGTPTFFINGERFDGVPDVDSLLAVLTQPVPHHA